MWTKCTDALSRHHNRESCLVEKGLRDKNLSLEKSGVQIPASHTIVTSAWYHLVVSIQGPINGIVRAGTARTEQTPLQRARGV